MIEENITSIKSFDENKDSQIDESELENATAIAMKWASQAKRGKAGWSYYGKDGAVGPKEWSEIEAIAQRQPMTYICQANSKYWLPAKIISFAIEQL